MAEITLKIPYKGEEVKEMVVLEWLKQEGEEVKEGEAVLEVETDKANLEIHSLAGGFISSQLVQAGDIIKHNDPFMTVETDMSKRESFLSKGNTHATLASVMVRLGVICEHCNHAIPVNGFLPSVKCEKCQETMELKGKLRWAELLNYQNPNIDIFTATLKHKPGQGDYGAWAPVKLKTWKNNPGCLQCDHPFEMDTIEQAIRGDKKIPCSNCSFTNVLKPAPAFITDAFPQVAYTLDRLPGNNTFNGKSMKGNTPVVMACMSCGATLSVDGSTRLVPCTFCGSSNYLPDDLWLALHPQPKMEDWYIVFRVG